jgi:hypothetical protein
MHITIYEDHFFNANHCGDSNGRIGRPADWADNMDKILRDNSVCVGGSGSWRICPACRRPHGGQRMGAVSGD